jgi:hypothetical protein
MKEKLKSKSRAEVRESRTRKEFNKQERRRREKEVIRNFISYGIEDSDDLAIYGNGRVK